MAKKITKLESAKSKLEWWQSHLNRATDKKEKNFCQRKVNHWKKEVKKLE